MFILVGLAYVKVLGEVFICVAIVIVLITGIVVLESCVAVLDKICLSATENYLLLRLCGRMGRSET